MSNFSFPTGVWGVITSHGSDQIVTAVMIEPTSPSGFLIITKEPSGTFDCWVESESQVSDYLKTVEVRWPNST